MLSCDQCRFHRTCVKIVCERERDKIVCVNVCAYVCVYGYVCVACVCKYVCVCVCVRVRAHEIICRYQLA